MNVGIGRKFGIDPSCSEEIQCNICLWYQPIPFQQWIVWIHSRKTRLEVTFIYLNGLLCNVVLMLVRSNQLIIYILLLKYIHEILRGFIIQDICSRCFSCSFKQTVHIFPGFSNGIASSIFYRGCMNVVSIIVVPY